MKRHFWKLALFAVLCVVGAIAAAAGTGRFSNRSTEVEAAGAAASLRLKVDLSQRKLFVIRDGETIESYDVAIGKASYPTPKGSFAIRRIIWNPRWVPPDSPWARKKKPKGPGEPGNPMGKVKIFFSEPDYYIHGTKEVDSLGQAESHGCLRMRNGDVTALARKVMAAGGKPATQSFVRRVINRIRSTHEVRLSNPVHITITA